MIGGVLIGVSSTTLLHWHSHAPATDPSLLEQQLESLARRQLALSQDLFAEPNLDFRGALQQLPLSEIAEGLYQDEAVSEKDQLSFDSLVSIHWLIHGGNKKTFWGSHDVLRRLVKGIKDKAPEMPVCIIVSSDLPDLAKEILSPWESLVQIVVSSEEKFFKPHFSMIDKALEIIGVRSENAVLIGEFADSDILAGIRALMPCIWLRPPDDTFQLCEYVHVQELVDHVQKACDVVTSSVDECIRIVCLDSPSFLPRKEFVIGYFLNAKKFKKFDSDNVLSLNHRRDIRFVFLDFLNDLIPDTHIDVLLVKATDIMVSIDLDPNASIVMERLRKFISGHPDVAIIDPLESVEQVIDRTKVASLIDSSEFRGPSDFVCVTPKFVFAKEDLVQKWINEEEPIPLRFPVICKPIKACGNRDSHQMVVLPSRAALDEVCDGEWLFQEFLNHDGVIYKAYVLGEFCQVFPRESLPNFPTELEDLSGASAVHFNSHDPISSSMFLADLESKHEEDILTPRGTRQPFRLSVDIALLQDFVKWVAQKLRGVLNLNMFGFDVIRESKTNVLYIVDINYFPSYKGVHDLSELIVRHISRQVSGSPYFILQ